MEDYVTVAMNSEVLGELVELDISNPFMIAYLRMELHKMELATVQERLDGGQYDSWTEEKKEARMFIRELKKELKKYEEVEKK